MKKKNQNYMIISKDFEQLFDWLYILVTIL